MNTPRRSLLLSASAAAQLASPAAVAQPYPSRPITMIVPASAMRDLMGGQIDIMLDQASNVLPKLSGGTIKVFAVTAKERLPLAPNVPAVDEAGLSALYVSVWHGVWAANGTPADVFAKLNAAIVKSLSEAGTRQKLAALGREIPPVEHLTPQARGAFQKAEIERWWPIVKDAGIKAE